MASFVEAMREAWMDPSKVVQETEFEDVRILPSKEDGDCERYRDFHESVGLMWAEEFTFQEFPSRAPRIAMWWSKDLKRDRTTPRLHHNTWVMQAEVGARAKGVTTSTRSCAT